MEDIIYIKINQDAFRQFNYYRAFDTQITFQISIYCLSFI